MFYLPPAPDDPYLKSPKPRGPVARTMSPLDPRERYCRKFTHPPVHKPFLPTGSFYYRAGFYQGRPLTPKEEQFERYVNDVQARHDEEADLIEWERQRSVEEAVIEQFLCLGGKMNEFRHQIMTFDQQDYESQCQRQKCKLKMLDPVRVFQKFQELYDMRDEEIRKMEEAVRVSLRQLDEEFKRWQFKVQFAKITANAAASQRNLQRHSMPLAQNIGQWEPSTGTVQQLQLQHVGHHDIGPVEPQQQQQQEPLTSLPWRHRCASGKEEEEFRPLSCHTSRPLPPPIENWKSGTGTVQQQQASLTRFSWRYRCSSGGVEERILSSSSRPSHPPPLPPFVTENWESGTGIGTHLQLQPQEVGRHDIVPVEQQQQQGPSTSASSHGHSSREEEEKTTPLSSHYRSLHPPPPPFPLLPPIGTRTPLSPASQALLLARLKGICLTEGELPLDAQGRTQRAEEEAERKRQERRARMEKSERERERARERERELAEGGSEPKNKKGVAWGVLKGPEPSTWGKKSMAGNWRQTACSPLNEDNAAGKGAPGNEDNEARRTGSGMEGGEGEGERKGKGKV